METASSSETMTSNHNIIQRHDRELKSNAVFSSFTPIHTGLGNAVIIDPKQETPFKTIS